MLLRTIAALGFVIAMAGPATAELAVDIHGDPLPPGAVARFGTIRWRPGAQCAAMAFTPDGKSLVSADPINGACVWEVATGKKLRQSGAFPGDFRCSAISRDGRWVALAGDFRGKEIANLFVILDANTGKEQVRIEDSMKDSIGDIVAAIAFSPDGMTLAARSFLSTAVTFWDARNGKRQRDLGKRQDVEQWIGGIQNWPNTISFSADGKLLAVSGEAGGYCLWNLVTGNAIPASPTSPRRLKGLQYSPDGNHVAWMEGQTIYLCDKTWATKPLRKIADDSFFSSSMAFSPDSSVLAAIDGDGILHCWDVVTGKHTVEVRVMRELGPWRGPGCLAFSPDGKTIAAAYGPTINLWDSTTGKLQNPTAGHALEVLYADLSPDGKTLVSYGMDETLHLWDGLTGKLRSRLFQDFDELSPLQELRMTPDGKAFVLPDENGHLCLRDAGTGAKLRVLVPPPIQAEAIAGLVLEMNPCSPLASWEAATGVMVQIGEPERTSKILRFSADGKRLLTRQTDERLCWWDVDAAKQIRRFDPSSGVLDNEWAGEDRWYAVLHRKRDRFQDTFPTPEYFQVWDALRSKVHWETSQATRVTTWAFDPGCHNLAAIVREAKPGLSVYKQPLIHIIEIRSGQVRRAFSEPADEISSLSFSPDGRLLLGEESPGQLRLWSVDTGEQLCTWQAHATWMHSAKFTRDSKRLITFGYDSTILLWDIATLTKHHQPKPASKLSAADFAQCWADLAHQEASIAFDAVCKLTAVPGKAVPLLEQHLKPVPHLDAKLIQGLLSDLGSDRYPVRQKASEALENLHVQVESDLKAALTSELILEKRQRIELLLKKIDETWLTAADIRGFRALEVLEKIGTPRATQHIAAIAGGEPKARLTQEATLAWRRLKAR